MPGVYREARRATQCAEAKASGQTGGIQVLMEDRNKTELTRAVTAAAVRYLDERGFKPIETEVPICDSWVADVAGVISPTMTELVELKLLRRKPGYRNHGYDEWWKEAKKTQRLMTMLVEVKTSRADFRGDRKWTMPLPTNLAYVAIPKDLAIGMDEMPANWGVLEYSEKADCMRCLRPPAVAEVTIEQQLSVVVDIAVRRDHDTRYERIRKFRKEIISSQNESISRTRVMTAMRAMLSIIRGKTIADFAQFFMVGELEEIRALFGLTPDAPFKLLKIKIENALSERVSSPRSAHPAMDAAREILYPDGKSLEGYGEGDVAEVAAIITRHMEPSPRSAEAQLLYQKQCGDLAVKCSNCSSEIAYSVRPFWCSQCGIKFDKFDNAALPGQPSPAPEPFDESRHIRMLGEHFNWDLQALMEAVKKDRLKTCEVSKPNSGPSQPSEGPPLEQIFSGRFDENWTREQENELAAKMVARRAAEPSEGLEQVAREIDDYYMGLPSDHETLDDMQQSAVIKHITAILARHFSGGKGAGWVTTCVEETAIAQLMESQGLSRTAVLRQALRTYQLVATGHAKLVTEIWGKKKEEPNPALSGSAVEEPQKCQCGHEEHKHMISSVGQPNSWKRPCMFCHCTGLFFEPAPARKEESAGPEREPQKP
jgi:hypothetical protein